MRSFSLVFGEVVGAAFSRVGAPLNRGSATRTLDLTTADAMIGLDAGIYAVFADGATSTAVLGLDVDTTAQPPASGSGEAEGIVVIPRDTSRDIVCDRAITLHARMLVGTATLRLTRRLP